MMQLTALLILFFIIPPTRSSTADDIEAARYSTLPPTVFAPTGRLFGVERVAREAILITESEDVESCSTVFAIRCGARPCGPEQENGEEEERGELTIMVGIGPISPSLHRDVEMYQKQSEAKHMLLSEQELNEIDELNDVKDEVNEHQLITMANNATTPFYKPLQISQQQQSALPISILSPTLITGTGGTSIDSSILLRRSIEVALSLYKLDNGGIEFFASHSLEGGTATTMEMDSTGGGAASVQIEALVRRIADMAQSSTQTLGSKYGRMLSSSLLAMGVQQLLPNDDEGRNGDKLCIWRVDPTGQFWKCEASAAGRGTVEVEAELLTRVQQWKKKNEVMPLTNDGSIDNSELDDQDVRITNNDVRSYLSSLTEDDAVRVASDCLVNGIMNCKGTPNEKRGGKGTSSLRDWMEYDLRRRMQCVILRSSCGIGRKQSLPMKLYEVVRRS